MDVVIANDVGKKNRGFEVDTNEAVLVTKKQIVHHFPLTTKRLLAEKIVTYLFTFTK